MNKAPALLALAAICGCGHPAQAPRQNRPAASPKAAPKPAESEASAHTAVEIHSVILIDGPIALRVRWLRGRMRPAKEGGIISFDDKSSFVIDVDAGAMGVAVDDVTKLMNQSVFAYPGAPLRNIKISAQGSQLQVQGTLRKGIDIPVEIVGDIGVTPDSRIRLHATKVHALHLPVKGLLGAFGVKLEDMIDTKRTKGISIDKDDVIIDPTAILPPPHTHGRLTDAHVHGSDLVILYGNGRQEVAATRPRKNYISFQGGTVQFAKLTMRDADLVMMDSGTNDWFYFLLDRYQEQLVQGYSKVTPEFGFIMYMPDYKPGQALPHGRASVTPPTNRTPHDRAAVTPRGNRAH